MNRPTHALLVDQRLHGFAAGMQRDLEAAIVRRTGAVIIPAPYPWPIRLVRRYTAAGTRYAGLAAMVPRRSFPIRCGELWVVAMGPPDFPLWYYRGWDQNASHTRLYLFDTFEFQLPTLRRLLAAGRWDQLITSFPAAVPVLERATGRRWQAVLQGVDPARFHPLPAGTEPVIGFSSYGRKLPTVHSAVAAFAARVGLNFDFTVASGLDPALDPRDNYQSYAWHLRQSWFTVSWPVEVTHPSRAGSFSPVTCRWFEAAASGTVVIGAAPTDPAFEAAFGPGFVEPLDPDAPPDKLHARLAELWDRRYELRAKRLTLAAERSHKWTWDERVIEMERGL